MFDDNDNVHGADDVREPAVTPVTADGVKPNKAPDSPPNKQVNLLSYVVTPDRPAHPEIVKTGRNETLLMLFTPNGLPVQVHYCAEPEIMAYVHCAGSGCLLCSAGNQADDKLLLPVLVLIEKRVGVLMIGTSLRPGSLLYQLSPHLQAAAKGIREIISIRRDGPVYYLGARPFMANEGQHLDLIQEFCAAQEAGTIDLSQTVQTLTTEQILAVDSIKQTLILKGAIDA